MMELINQDYLKDPSQGMSEDAIKIPDTGNVTGNWLKKEKAFHNYL